MKPQLSLFVGCLPWTSCTPWLAPVRSASRVHFRRDVLPRATSAFCLAILPRRRGILAARIAPDNTGPRVTPPLRPFESNKHGNPPTTSPRSLREKSERGKRIKRDRRQLNLGLNEGSVVGGRSGRHLPAKRWRGPGRSVAAEMRHEEKGPEQNRLRGGAADSQEHSPVRSG